MREIRRINIDKRSQANQDWWSHDFVIKIYNQDWLHNHIENLHDLKLYSEYNFNLSENVYNFWLKSLILIFFSYAMSCILWRHHSLTLNRIISLSLKLSWSLLVLSHYIAFILFHYYFICLQLYKLMTWIFRTWFWNKCSHSLTSYEHCRQKSQI